MTTAIIPARGNSKGLKSKNLQTVKGKSLLERAVEHGKATCDRVIVTSEDRKILDVAELLGAIPHHRPDCFSTDEGDLRSVVIEVIGRRRLNDNLLILLPTYPFRAVEETKSFLARFEGCLTSDSALCSFPVEDHPDLCFLDDDLEGKTFVYRRQERKPAFRLYHKLIACHSRTIKDLDGGFFNSTTIFFELKERPIDIDTQEDLDRANGVKPIPSVTFYEAQ